MYQQHGRVGRSNRRAYAYLLIPADRDLTELARRRLAALKEFSDLGAGFKIAALDLELRGAGNMLGGEQSAHVESFQDGLLEYPQYTRPVEFRGDSVPEVLQNGHHAEIEKWRHEQAVAKTRRNRPDLLEHHEG